MQNKFYFTGSFSNIYKKPSKFSEVTSQILYGEKFKILSKTKNWIKIKSNFDNYTGYIQNKESKDEVEAIIQGDMQSILSITEKAKDGPSLALVEGVIPNSIISNVKYSGFIVKYET